MTLVLNEVLSRGARTSNIRIICAIAAAPALKELSNLSPEIKIYTGMIDAEVNDEGYVVPGIGDVGDRAFGRWSELGHTGNT